MTGNYTFIAYKTDSEQTSRGLSVCTYPSDFKIATCLSREQVIEEFVSCELKNKDLDWSEDGYDIFIMYNQYLFYKTSQFTNTGCIDYQINSLNYEESMEDSEEFDPILAEEYISLSREIENSKTEIEKRLKEIEAQKKLELEEKRKKEIYEKEEYDRIIFEKLKKKFEKE